MRVVFKRSKSQVDMIRHSEQSTLREPVCLKGQHALSIIILRIVHSCAHWESSHLTGIWLQEIGNGLDPTHARIKPQIVIVFAENDGHSVVNGSRHSVRSRRQYRARLDPLPARVFPPLPQAREREQFAIVDLKAKRLLRRSATLAE